MEIWYQQFLKESAEQLTVPLCFSFRKFLDSLTSALCKVFESILKDKITKFFTF